MLDKCKDFIFMIKTMYYNDDALLHSINDVNELYNALCDLNDITGMDEVKDSIIKQIKFLLINNNKNNNGNFENHMLHTVVYGPPGVGKTMIGSCLAKVWKSLGLVHKKKVIINKNKHSNSIAQKADKFKILSVPIFFLSKKDGKTIISENINVDEKKSDDENNNDNNMDQILEKIPNENDEQINKETPSFENINKSVDELIQIKKNIRKINLLTCGLKNIKSHIKSNNKNKLERIKNNSPIAIVSRPDFVGQYIGHTCDKTQKLLSSVLEEGKVLFIDEAYSLVLDEKDSFGHEALNELNRFMSEHPELVVIFAGYKDKMENTLFKYQPGFKRRCTWLFEINNYTGAMLAKIFKSQLEKDDWQYTGSDKKLNNFFEINMNKFDAFGGDTIKLVLYCKLKYSELKFQFNDNLELQHKIITHDILLSAYNDIYCKNKYNDKNDDKLYEHMYV